MEADFNRLLATKDEDRIYSEYYYYQTGRGIGRTSSNIHFYLIAMGALIVVGGVLLAQSLELTAEPLPFPSVRELVFESPSLSITSPISGSTVTAEAFVIQGATSNFLTSAVSVQVDSSTPIIATPKAAGDWSTWSLSVIISDAGPHTLTAASTDEGGVTHTDSITIITGNIPIGSSLYDDFAGGTFTLSDGQLSPNGKWKNVYTGYGSVGAKDGVFYEVPQAASAQSVINPDQTTSGTSAALTLTTSTFEDVRISVDVRTIQQVANRDPNTWEVAWIFWNYVDKWHHYYLVQKTNGIEIGKKDNVQQLEQQVFMYTESSPKANLGQWHHWDIETVGNHIVVYVDGVKVAEIYDDTQSGYFADGGNVGLYTEDASVEFDNLYIAPL